MSGSTRRRATLTALAAWVVCVVVLTTAPSGGVSSLTWGSFFCVGCDWRSTSDVVLNWALFVPGGILLSLLVDERRALVMAVSFTLAIELVQIGIPSRAPGLQDILANGAGALSGSWIVCRGLRRRGRWLVWALASLAWLSPAALLVPTRSGTGFWVEWTPEHRGQRYSGTVVSASVGGVDLPPGLAGDPRAIDVAAAARENIRVTVRRGAPPSRMTPVFRVSDEHAFAVVDLGVVGHDLMFRGHPIAHLLHLDSPPIRWQGALSDVAVNEEVSITLARGERATCLSIDERTSCDSAPSLRDGWGLLLEVDEAPRWARAIAGLLWCIGLGTVAGAAYPGPFRRVAGTLVVPAVGLALAYLSPDLSSALVDAALFSTGAVLGLALARTGRLRTGPVG